MRHRVRQGRAGGPLVALALAVTVGSAGCQGFLTRKTGQLMSDFAVDHMAPYMMATDDASMICETGVSLASFLLAYGRVTETPHEAAISALVPAANCAEQKAAEAELASLRAVGRGQASEAKDARTRAKRHYEVAARRYHRAWSHWSEAWGGADEEGCPELGARHELPYLLGLVAGLQSVRHDRAASGAVGVPLDVPRRAGRATRCLDDERWWGAPKALQAAVWTSTPAEAPEGKDPWKLMRRAREIGREQGVLLASAIRIQALEGAGREEELHEAIRAFGETFEDGELSAEWRALNGNARTVVMRVSDRVWTEATGHRTPFGELGELPEDEADEAEEDDAGGQILEGLGGGKGGAGEDDAGPNDDANDDEGEGSTDEEE